MSAGCRFPLQNSPMCCALPGFPRLWSRISVASPCPARLALATTQWLWIAVTIVCQRLVRADGRGGKGGRRPSPKFPRQESCAGVMTSCCPISGPDRLEAKATDERNICSADEGAGGRRKKEIESHEWTCQAMAPRFTMPTCRVGPVLAAGGMSASGRSQSPAGKKQVRRTTKNLAAEL